MTARSIRDQVAEMRPRRYTTADMAELLNVSHATVVRWRRRGVGASDSVRYGEN